MNKKHLKIEQKSIYLIILNATMILRSIGKTFKGSRKKLKNFKIRLFKEVERLINKMEAKRLQEKDIISSIGSMSNKFNISFGQAQKAINVLLKYHYYLYEKYLDKSIEKILHCPLDSVILERLGIYDSLTQIGRKQYMYIQKVIGKKRPSKISFDKKWDVQHLKEGGLL